LGSRNKRTPRSSTLASEKLDAPVPTTPRTNGLSRKARNFFVTGPITAERAPSDSPSYQCQKPRRPGRLRYPLDVDYEHIRLVMREAGDVVDPNKSSEDTDPYVIAQAVQLQAQGLEVVVVTDDDVDRMPIKISLTTAYSRLGVRHVGSRGFLTSSGIKVRRASVQGDGEDE